MPTLCAAPVSKGDTPAARSPHREAMMARHVPLRARSGAAALRALAVRILALVILPVSLGAQPDSSGRNARRQELTVEQWRADLRAFADGLRRNHRNLH